VIRQDADSAGSPVPTTGRPEDRPPVNRPTRSATTPMVRASGQDRAGRHPPSRRTRRITGRRRIGHERPRARSTPIASVARRPPAPGVSQQGEYLRSDGAAICVVAERGGLFTGGRSLRAPGGRAGEPGESASCPNHRKHPSGPPPRVPGGVPGLGQGQAVYAASKATSGASTFWDAAASESGPTCSPRAMRRRWPAGAGSPGAPASGRGRVEVHDPLGEQRRSDSTWSGWSTAYANPDASVVTSPSARYSCSGAPRWRAPAAGQGASVRDPRCSLLGALPSGPTCRRS